MIKVIKNPANRLGFQYFMSSLNRKTISRCALRRPCMAEVLLG